MKQLILLFSLLIFLGCETRNSNPSKNKVEKSMNQPSKSMTELKKEVLYNGDVNAYKELDIAYLDYTFQEEFLLYALIMANKYDYPQAYFDVYICLTDVYLSDISRIDEETASLAIEYLLKAYEKGHHQAKDIVEEHLITRSSNSKQQIMQIYE